MTRRGLCCALVLSLAACRPDAVEQREAGGVSSESLGLSLAELPTGCAVTDPERLALACRSEAGTEGQLWVELGPEGQHNLLEAARGQREAFEALPDGEFRGNRELVTPSGTAYTARGRWREDGRWMEESRAIALHPDGDRPVILRLRYPGGDDTAERIQQLLFALGELQPTDSEGPEP